MDSSWKINPSKAAGIQRASLQVSGIKMTEQWRVGGKKNPPELSLYLGKYSSHASSGILGTQKQLDGPLAKCSWFYGIFVCERGK